MLFTFNKLKKKHGVECWQIHRMYSKIKDEMEADKQDTKSRKVNISSNLIKNPIRKLIKLPVVGRAVVEKKVETTKKDNSDNDKQNDKVKSLKEDLRRVRSDAQKYLKERDEKIKLLENTINELKSDLSNKDKKIIDLEEQVIKYKSQSDISDHQQVEDHLDRETKLMEQLTFFEIVGLFTIVFSTYSKL